MLGKCVGGVGGGLAPLMWSAVGNHIFLIDSCRRDCSYYRFFLVSAGVFKQRCDVGFKGLSRIQTVFW